MSILEKAIEIFGKENQMIVAVEELSELQKEIIKIIRGEGNVFALAEEIADVEIMIEQLKIMFPETNEKIAMYTDYKFDRLKKLVEKIELAKLIGENDRC